jgi:hypothetical protein
MPQNHVKYTAMVARGAASVKANQVQTTAKCGRPNASLGRFGGRLAVRRITGHPEG